MTDKNKQLITKYSILFIILAVPVSLITNQTDEISFLVWVISCAIGGLLIIYGAFYGVGVSRSIKQRVVALICSTLAVLAAYYLQPIETTPVWSLMFIWIVIPLAFISSLFSAPERTSKLLPKRWVDVLNG